MKTMQKNKGLKKRGKGLAVGLGIRLYIIAKSLILLGFIVFFLF